MYSQVVTYNDCKRQYFITFKSSGLHILPSQNMRTSPPYIVFTLFVYRIYNRFKESTVVTVGYHWKPLRQIRVTYKLFTKVITARISYSLDSNQPREQAGFRSGFSATNHTLTQIREKNKRI
ncbi:uncharacterized protein [Penaeus vannamei]|uniref:uncharacterized protein n=1 Tax=Penaeus vannamei TaxID=6689 RepID=UPI00387F4826